MRQVKELPAGQLRPITEIRIFRQRVVLPSACCLDGSSAPNTRRTVEIEKPAGQVPAAVFDDEMTIENDGFHLRQE